MTTSVLAAFFASGGLNAGTPLAIASVPVSATEPLANALQQQQDAEGLGAQRHRLGLGRQGRHRRRRRCGTAPIATISSASPTNR